MSTRNTVRPVPREDAALLPLRLALNEGSYIMEEPLHWKSDSAPCEACGARWVPERDGSLTMDHAATCSYILNQDEEANAAEFYERA
jgi:hypothetical protein